MTSADLQIVSENSTSGWGQNPGYIPRAGEICIYTDHKTHTDESGNLVNEPDIKIGDGQVPIIDLPFISDGFVSDIVKALNSHVSDSIIHVTQEDRQRWDAKLNFNMNGEELIFTRI